MMINRSFGRFRVMTMFMMVCVGSKIRLDFIFKGLLLNFLVITREIDQWSHKDQSDYFERTCKKIIFYGFCRQGWLAAKESFLIRFQIEFALELFWKVFTRSLKRIRVSLSLNIDVFGFMKIYFDDVNFENDNYE